MATYIPSSSLLVYYNMYSTSNKEEENCRVISHFPYQPHYSGAPSCSFKLPLELTYLVVGVLAGFVGQVDRS